MRQEEVIQKVREIRDEALSLKNVTEVLCTPDDQQSFSQQKSGRVTANAETALAYLDNLDMYYGGQKDLGDIKDGLTLEAFAKEEFGSETVNGAFRAYEDPAYMKFARNEIEGLSKAAMTPSERDSCIMDMGYVAECYNDILHDPAYVNGNEVSRLHVLDEAYKKDRFMNITMDGHVYGLEKTSAESELSALAHKKDVQETLKRLCQSRRAQDVPRTKESLMDDYKYIYARLIADPPGTKQTGWQLRQLDELCTLVGGKSRKKELDDILKDVKVYDNFVERFHDLAQKAKNQNDALQESIGLGAGPKFSGPPLGRLIELRREYMKDINDHLLKHEQENIMNLAKDFEDGRDFSAKAACAYTLAESTRKPVFVTRQYDLMPDKYRLESVLTETFRKGDSKPEHWPLDEVMKAMRELVPFVPHQEIQAAALRDLDDAGLRRDYQKFQRDELKKIYDRAYILKSLRAGNTKPLEKRVKLLLDALSPDSLRHMKDRKVSQTSKAVQRAAEETIETFKEAANKFLPNKMKFPTKSQER